MFRRVPFRRPQHSFAAWSAARRVVSRLSPEISSNGAVHSLACCSAVTHMPHVYTIISTREQRKHSVNNVHGSQYMTYSPPATSAITCTQSFRYVFRSMVVLYWVRFTIKAMLHTCTASVINTASTSSYTCDVHNTY